MLGLFLRNPRCDLPRDERDLILGWFPVRMTNPLNLLNRGVVFRFKHRCDLTRRRDDRDVDQCDLPTFPLDGELGRIVVRCVRKRLLDFLPGDERPTALLTDQIAFRRQLVEGTPYRRPSTYRSRSSTTWRTA